MTSDYRIIESILKDDRFSAKRIDTLFARLPQEVLMDMDEIMGVMKRWTLMLDPPEHEVLRSVLNEAFSPKWIKSLEGEIEDLCETLFRGISDLKKFDFVQQVAYPLPAMVIARILGVPDERMDWFKVLSKDIAGVFNLSSRPEPEIAYAGLKAIRELHAYLEEVLKDREAHPCEDFMSEIGKKVKKGFVSREDAKATLSMLLLAGHETTTQLLANGMLCFARKPQSFLQLKNNPSLLNTAIEEILRFESPVQLTSRQSLEVIELAGQTIQAGQRVMMFLGGANRDSAIFEDSECFDITRKHNRHLSFGAGRHYCVGAMLARLEAMVVFGKIITDHNKVQSLESSPEWHVDVAFRSLKQLPLSLV